MEEINHLNCVCHVLAVFAGAAIDSKVSAVAMLATVPATTGTLDLYLFAVAALVLAMSRLAKPT